MGALPALPAGGNAVILRSRAPQWLIRVLLDDGEERYYPNRAARRRWGPFTRVRFVAEHYDSPEAAHASAERLRGLPGSRVVSYAVEERRPS